MSSRQKSDRMRPDPTRRVEEIMRRDFVTVSADTSLDEAVSLMRMARLRHLPVEEEGRLVGLLSYRELQEWALARLQPVPSASPAPLSVSEAMMDSPYFVTPETTLQEAATRLTNLRVGCLPVIARREAGGRLVGLLTESDLLRAAYPKD